MKRIAKWTAAIAAVLIGAWAIASVVEIAANQQSFREDRAELASEVDELEEQADANAAALDVANDRLRDAGKAPVAEPEEGEDAAEVIEGEPGEDGARGPRGPSCIEDIGREACRGDDGTSGSNGADGSSGSDGEDGSDGAPGEPGEQGPQGEPGAPGPAGPQGPQGPEGPQGPAGKDGTLPSGTAGCPEGQYVQQITYGPEGLTVVCATPALVPIG